MGWGSEGAKPQDIAVFQPKDLEEGLSLEVMNKICDLVRNGNHLNVSAGECGVDPEVVYSWMTRGKEGKVGFEEFYKRVTQAQAEHESRLVDLWQNHFDKDYKAIRDFMARRYPNRWSEKSRVEHTGENGGPIKIDVASLSEEELDSMRQMVKKLGSGL